MMNEDAIRQRTQSIKNKNGPFGDTIKITHFLIYALLIFHYNFKFCFPHLHRPTVPVTRTHSSDTERDLGDNGTNNLGFIN